MEYRKLEPGTKLRLISGSGGYNHARIGDTLVVVEDDGTSIPYSCRVERNGEGEWFFACDVELAEATPTPYRKVVTLLFDEGIEVTLDVDGTAIVKDGFGGGATIPFATLLAAVDELRGHTK